MPDESATRRPPTDQRTASRMPAQESHQPDPMLQMTTGRMGAGGITLAAFVAAVILGVVFYGLNGGGRSDQTVAAPPPPNAQPQAGGNTGPAPPGTPQANQSGVKG